MLQVFDRVLASQSGDTLLVLMLGVGVALALLLALDYLRARLQGVAGNIVAESLSPTVVTKIVVAQGARRSGRGHGEGLRDVGALRSLFSAQGLLALFDAPWVVVYVGVIWLAHPVLGMAAAAAALLMLGAGAGQRPRHAARHRGAAEGRRRRHALPRSLAAERRGGADAGHDRCADRALAAEERRGHRAAAPDGAQVGGDGGAHAHAAPGGAGR